MATVPLSAGDCDFLAEAVHGVAYGAKILLDNAQAALAVEPATRSTARNFLLSSMATIQADHDRAVRLRDFLRDHAAMDRQPVVPEDQQPRTCPPPASVDTFPADHPSRRAAADPATWGDSPHDQEPSA